MSRSYISIGFDFAHSTFSTAEFTLNVPLNGATIKYRRHAWDGTIESWTTLTTGGSVHFYLGNVNHPDSYNQSSIWHYTHVDLQGIGNSTIGGISNSCISITQDYGDLEVSGDLESILEGQDSPTVNFNLPYGAFYAMFRTTNGCIRNIDNLIFPNKALPAACCQYMFEGNKIENIPSNFLSGVSSLNRNCFFEMFKDCASIKTLPATLLPFTTLASGCYSGMFRGCSSLTTIPTNFLPSTNLAGACYSSMFKSCTSLVTVPVNLLPATSLTNHVYQEMFMGCSKLTNVPNLPTTSLPSHTYIGMFKNCSSLETVPLNLLPATTVWQYSYQEMFMGCSKLTQAPRLPATTIYHYSYDSMFMGCSSLVNPPDLPATSLGEYCYSNMFRNCTSLETLPALPATTLPYACYMYMFMGCSKIKISDVKTVEYKVPYKIPSEAHSVSVGNSATSGMFNNTGGPWTGGTPAVDRKYYLQGEAPPGGFNLYVGVNGTAREVTAIYVGVNGVAREVTAMYVGVNGLAREV